MLGIIVDIILLHWQKILKLAKKAYVPNSDQSRKKGAGGKEDID